jgi:hypothetical protein
LNTKLGLQDQMDYGQAVGAGFMGLGKGPISSPVAAMTGTTAQTLIDSKGKDYPSFSQLGAAAVLGSLGKGDPAPASAKNSLRTVAQSEGYVFPPSEANPSLLNKALASTGGQANTNADFSIRNQTITNSLGARAIGMPGQPLTQDTINQAWMQANQPMQKLAAASPEIAQMLQEVRQLRYDAAQADYKYNTSQPGVSLRKNPALKIEAGTAQALADQKESQLAAAAKQAGTPGLYTDYVAGRIQQAKVGMVDDNFDETTGELSAKGLGKALKNGAPLTDELQLIASTHNNFDDWMKDASKVTPPGSNKLNAVGMIVGAKEGYDAAGVPGMIAGGALPFADAGARSAMASSLAQKLLAQPPSQNPTFASNLAKYLSLNLSSPPNPQVANGLAQGGP